MIPFPHAAAGQAARAIARKVFAYDEVLKAAKKPSPLAPSGFDAYVLDVVVTLSEELDPIERAAAMNMVKTLQRQWGGLTPKQREAAIKQAADKYIAAWKPPPTIGATLSEKGVALAEETRKANARAHNLHELNASLSLVDVAAVEAIAAQQVLYVTNAAKDRVEALSETARGIVAQGLADGLDDHTIADQLASALPLAALGRSHAYLRMISSTFIARGRAYATVSSFQEAGIRAFQIVGVVDQLTCEPCRYMHGRIFNTALSIGAMDAANASEDPTAVKDALPWLGVGKDPDSPSGKAIFTKVAGVKYKIASINQKSSGENDAIGRYKSAMSSKQMGAMGIGSPPFHGFCRCVQVPVFGDAPVRARGPAPAETFDVPDGKQATPTVAQPGKVWPPNKLPDNLADLVRPLPKYRDYETSGPLASKPPSASPASTEVQWKKKLSELPPPPAGYGAAWVQLPIGAGTGLPDPDLHKVLTTYPKAAQLKKLKALSETAVPLSLITPMDGPKAVGLSTKALEFKADPNAFDKDNVPAYVVKKGGQYWLTNHSYGAGAQILVSYIDGKDYATLRVLDLDGAKPKPVKKPKAAVMPPVAAPKPPPPPPPPPPVKLAEPHGRTVLGKAENVLGRQDGAQRGSNEGGFYVGQDGVRRYVKFYEDPTQAWGEHLANNIYNEMGLTAPNSALFMKNGKVAYSSVIFEGGKVFGEVPVTQERARKFTKGFVADILMGNWDVADGAPSSNAMELPNGKVARIDNGGSFLHRAANGRKPEKLLNAISEWEVLFSPTNPSYQTMLRRAGYNNHIDAAQDILTGMQAMRDMVKREGGSWGKYVDRVAWGMDPADKAQVVAMLDARTALLLEKEKWLLGQINKPQSKPPQTGGARYIAQQYSTTTPRVGLKMSDLPASAVADIERPKSRGDTLPSGEPIQDYKRRIRRDVAMPDDTKYAVNNFAAESYGVIRESEAEGKPNDDARAIHELWGPRSVAKQEPGTVWRGINVSDSDIAKSVVESYLNNPTGLFQLNTTNVRDATGRFKTQFANGTSSSSWDFSVAADDFMGGIKPPTYSGGVRVLFKLNGKTQIPIEHEAVESERELLLRHDSVWRITGLSRLEGVDGVLMVEAEEVDPAELPKSKPTKPSRKPRSAPTEEDPEAWGDL